MNEWFKKTVAHLKELWQKWSLVQKIILAGIVVVIIVAIVLLASLSSRPDTVRLYSQPVTDDAQLAKIVSRLEKDNVDVYVSNDGYISVKDKATAAHYRPILIAEGLEPSNVDVYSLLDTTSWSRNDFDDRTKWLRVTQSALKEHLEQLSGIARAEVRLVLPEETLFRSEQNPVSASVILYAEPNSDVLQKSSQVKGIQHLILTSVEGLTEENLSIVDGSTNVEINDWDGMAEADRISNIQKQQRLILKLETQYSSQVLDALQAIYTPDRVRIANMKIDMDMSEKQNTELKYTPFVMKEDNPNTVYDDSDIRESALLSEESVDIKETGTGYNPEGPAGTSGQNPPVYSDMSNVITETTQQGTKKNYAIGQINSSTVESPSIDRITVSVNVDGTWRKVVDEKGNYVMSSTGKGFERSYTPVSEEDLAQITRLVQGAVGYNKDRGDVVTVTNIAFNRQAEFDAEDEAYLKAQNTRRTILFALIGVAAVLIIFILVRFISRELERRRRLKEEELLRKQQAEREQALWDAKEQGVEVTMSVEERRRAELQENAIALAKEHPEDVAMLIRTWLMEE